MIKKNRGKFECNIICIYPEIKYCKFYARQNNNLKHFKNILLFKKMTSKEDTLRKRVYAFHEKHCDKSKTFTVNHFEAEGVPR